MFLYSKLIVFFLRYCLSVSCCIHPHIDFHIYITFGDPRLNGTFCGSVGKSTNICFRMTSNTSNFNENIQQIQKHP